MSSFLFALVLFFVVLGLWLLPGKLSRVLYRFGKRFIRKQIKHEIRRFKPW